MKLLGISGSPREGGNTDQAVREILRQALTHGPLETELLRLADSPIEHCRGCRRCMKLNRCVIEDGFAELWSRVTGADALVVGAPVYWFSPPGVMKDFIDRSHGVFACREGTALGEKPVLVVSVAADSGFEPHEAVIRSWLEYYGADITDYVRVYAREKDDLVRDPDQMESLRSAADVFCSTLLPG